MAKTPFRLLLLDPNFVTRIALTSRLEATGYMVRAEKTVGTAARAATSSNWDLIIASASLAIPDLEAFLETLTMTECKAGLCLVVEPDDAGRREIAVRFRAGTVPHPVRPQALAEFMPKRPDETGDAPKANTIFRTA